MEHECYVKVGNRYGLHARTSTLLAQIANRFEAEVMIRREGSTEDVDAKSILSVMTLGAGKGQVLRIKARGLDANAAIGAITELFEKNFNEE